MLSKQEAQDSRKDYWSIRPTDIYQALGTSEHGLSEQEAQQRIEKYGYNELPEKGVSWAQVLLRQFKNPVSGILFASAIVAGFFGQLEQSIVILAMILLSAILGFYNEYNAEKTVRALRRSVSVKAVVTRDGRPSEIDARLVVPGDVVSVYVGDVASADMRIVQCKELQVNEAVLTGESFPVEKTSDGLDLQRPTPQQLTNYSVHGHCGSAWKWSWRRGLDRETHGVRININ